MTQVQQGAVRRSVGTLRPSRFPVAMMTMVVVVSLAVLILASSVILTGTDAYAGVTAKQTPERIELEFWRAIKDSSDPAEYEAYLELYPNGKFATLAKIRARSLRASQGAATPAPAPAPAPSKPAKAKSTPEPKIKTAADAPAGAELPPPGVFRDCGACPEMIDIPAGEFKMGSVDGDPSSSPAHGVTVAKGFAVGRHEITVGQWGLCVAEGGCAANSRHKDLDSATPAVNLSWRDATEYAFWLTEYTGRPYRLLTEAEWEYVARAGSPEKFWWGANFEEGFANCRDCGGEWDKGTPAQVGSFPSNGFGLFAALGGVREWVADCWNTNHEKAPGDASVRASGDCARRVLRGGSWRDKSANLAVPYRQSYDATVRYVTNGTRVALDTGLELAN